MRGLAIRRRALWVGLGAALLVLAVLIGLGRFALWNRDARAPTQGAARTVASQAGSAKNFSPSEQQILGLLPPGYTAAACARATDPFPTAVASLDCSQSADSGTPTYARFTLYDDLDALTGDFQTTASGMLVSACPADNTFPLPGTWSYGSNPSQIGGKVVCGSVADRANIAWTRDAQLLLATVNGGPNLDSLYQWWQRYGILTQH
ncbi:hypothetical protein [Mycobacterium sp. 852002-50816_SCH5313054-b]|uniref:hypothetical protein n=1 Tax=Mycobacterium sp. 852002-50816_SCH5313054-b TaxID=1834092 RepID=UPI000A4F82DD|nr:hypothetical protein [Mycobacterium sp. 852002-50816_SCH5313054-b]